NIDLSYTCDIDKTPLSVIVSDNKTKGRTIFYSTGKVTSNFNLFKENDLSADLLHISSMGEVEMDAISWAKRNGIPIMLDADYYSESFVNNAHSIDLFIGSEHFFERYQPSLLLEEKLEKIQELGPEIVGVTLGSKGCWVKDVNGLNKFEGFTINPIDTTGAGDVFHGAFAYGYLKKWDLKKIVLFSNAVAAMSCMVIGGRKGIPNYNNVLNFLEQHDINFK